MLLAGIFIFGGIAMASIAWVKKIQVFAYGAVSFFLVAGLDLMGVMSTVAWDIYFLGGWMVLGMAIACGVEAMALRSEYEEKVEKELDKIADEDKKDINKSSTLEEHAKKRGFSTTRASKKHPWE